MITARTLKLTGGTTTTIVGGLNIHGKFGLPMNVISSSGTPAVISANIGVINCNFIALQNITGSGGSTFNAINSVDNGGNTGWNFVINQIFQVLVSGVWKNVTKMQISIGGVWKNVVAAKIKANNQWKDVV